MTPKTWARLALGGVLAIGAVWGLLHIGHGFSHDDVADLERRLRQAGMWAPAVFVALYAFATVLFVPGSLFSLAGGALFGPVLGSVLNLIGATAGAMLAFLVARHLAADWVRRRTGPRLAQIVAGIDAEGWRFVALVRLVPLFPFNLVNYALGLTRIPPGQYGAASLICMAPGAIAYTWLGHAGREAATGSATAVRSALFAVGLLAAVALLARLVRRIHGGARRPAD